MGEGKIRLASLQLLKINWFRGGISKAGSTMAGSSGVPQDPFVKARSSLENPVKRQGKPVEPFRGLSISLHLQNGSP
uniref:Uncharacterized protein n=1 Tax=Vespula pensylvanica TaxID=30213 RepID=A0A834NHC4_VESPE|nr:hypothetical protein H0235_013967 [Vespula pensylvanica]